MTKKILHLFTINTTTYIASKNNYFVIQILQRFRTSTLYEIKYLQSSITQCAILDYIQKDKVKAKHTDTTLSKMSTKIRIISNLQVRSADDLHHYCANMNQMPHSLCL